MINNINNIIKIDYGSFCEVIKDSIKTIYDVDAKNIPNDINVITKWVEKVQDDHIINELKKDNIEHVAKLMEVR
jgi:hypothetical protein